MFEPENLANASPATVSRAGIIYVSDSELGWQPVVASWLQVCAREGRGMNIAVELELRIVHEWSCWDEPLNPRPPSPRLTSCPLQSRPEREAAALRPCFDKYVGPLLDFVRLELRPVMHNEQVCQVQTLLTLLTGVLKPLAGGSGGGGGSGGATLAPDHYERLFLYCATWSLGGLLDARERPRFDAHLRSLTDQAPDKVGGGWGTDGVQGIGGGGGRMGCRASVPTGLLLALRVLATQRVPCPPVPCTHYQHPQPWCSWSVPGAGGRHLLRVPGGRAERAVAALAGAHPSLGVPRRRGAPPLCAAGHPHAGQRAV